MELPDDGCNFFIHSEIFPVAGISENVLGTSGTSRKHQCVKIFHMQFGEWGHFAPGDAGRFHQAVPSLRHRLSGKMVHHFVLVNVRCKYLVLCPVAVNGIE